MAPTPGDAPLSTATPVEVVERYLQGSVEKRPSLLASLGLTAIQVLSSGAEDDAGGASSEPLAVAFTDLENFTAFTSREGDEAASRLLAEHHRAVGPLVRSRGGRVAKRLGDGLLLTFPEPEAAVLACLELVGSNPEPLRLRAGVHMGDLVVTRDDVIGHVVNVAAHVTESARWRGARDGRRAQRGSRAHVGALRALPPEELQGRRRDSAHQPRRVGDGRTVSGAFDLTDNVALVTGGNSGIGLGMTPRLWPRRAPSIAIWGTNEEKNLAAAEQLRSHGRQVVALRCDVGDEAPVEEAFAETVEALGRVDSCFANAGVSGARQSLRRDDHSRNGARVLQGQPRRGVLHVPRRRAPHGRARRRRRLVGTASLAAIEGAARSEHYAATKGAVISMVRSLAVEFARHGMRANAMLPGWIETDMTATPSRNEKFVKQRVAAHAHAPLGPGPTTSAAMAVYLASPASALPHRRHAPHRRRLLVVLSRPRPDGPQHAPAAGLCVGDDDTHGVADRERGGAAYGIEPVVVGGDDDRERRGERIERDEHLHPCAGQGGDEHERAPCGPAEVQARHGRVLVGDLVHGARVERPQAAVHVKRVDEAERRRQQARRRRG